MQVAVEISDEDGSDHSSSEDDEATIAQRLAAQEVTGLSIQMKTKTHRFQPASLGMPRQAQHARCAPNQAMPTEQRKSSPPGRLASARSAGKEAKNSLRRQKACHHLRACAGRRTMMVWQPVRMLRAAPRELSFARGAALCGRKPCAHLRLEHIVLVLEAGTSVSKHLPWRAGHCCFC